MGVEYCHGLAVCDLNWMPKSDKEFPLKFDILVS